jgi:hypothetical protein
MSASVRRRNGCSDIFLFSLALHILLFLLICFLVLFVFKDYYLINLSGLSLNSD